MMYKPVEEKANLRLVCSTCSKPVRQQRKGSLTSWVFGGSSCSCRNASPITVKITDAEETLPSLGERYQAIQVLGRGGMGTVYCVFDSSTGSVRAIKVLHDELKYDQELVKRFMQEFELLHSLDHPNLTTIHDHGFTESGAPYLVMDLVEGKSVAQALSEGGAFDRESILQIAREICNALSYIHSKGIVHRDLKPSNVLLEELPDGSLRARLVDFGIAKLDPSTSRESMDLTQTGDVFGTPTYMSPEQCMGFKLDERSDIYSLGCVIYEMIAGHPPFQASNPMQLVIKHINDAPRRPGDGQDKGASDALQDLVMCCLAKDAGERYQTVDDIKHHLDELAAGRSPKIRLPRKHSKSAHSTKQALLICASIVALLGYIAVLFSPGPIAILFLLSFVVLLPVSCLSLIRYYRKFGVGRSAKEAARLIFRVTLAVLPVSAIPVLLILPGWFETLPAPIQPLLILPFVFHIVYALAALAAAINLLLSSDDRRFGISAAGRRFAVMFLITLVPCALLLPRTLSNYAVLNHVGLKNLSHAFVKTSLDLNSKRPEAYARLALLDQDANPAAAINSLTEALNLSGYTGADLSKPYHRMLVRWRSQILNKHGQREQAIKEITGVIDEFDRNHNVDHWKYDLQLRRWRAGFYLDNGDYDLAIKDYSRSIAVSPGLESTEAYEGRAIAYYRKGDVPAAVRDLTSVISFEGVDKIRAAEFYIKRALLLDAYGRHEQAMQDFESASKLLSDFDQTPGYMPFYAGFLAERNAKALESKVIPYLMRGYVGKRLDQTARSEQDLGTAASMGFKLEDLFEDFRRLAKI